MSDTFSFILLVTSGVPVACQEERDVAAQTDGKPDVSPGKVRFDVLNAVEIAGIVRQNLNGGAIPL